MPRFERKPKEIFALQIVRANLDAIKEHFKCRIEIYPKPQQIEYDGYLMGDDWARHFKLDDWIIDDLSGSTPRVMDDEDFEDDYAEV